MTVINLIPLKNKRKPVDARFAFPPMHTLYLELIENKKKVKEELKNSEYVSKTPVVSNEKSYKEIINLSKLSRNSMNTSFTSNNSRTSAEKSLFSDKSDGESKIAKELEKSNYGFQRKLYNFDIDDKKYDSDNDYDKYKSTNKSDDNNNDYDKYKSTNNNDSDNESNKKYNNDNDYDKYKSINNKNNDYYDADNDESNKKSKSDDKEIDKYSRNKYYNEDNEDDYKKDSDKYSRSKYHDDDDKYSRNKHYNDDNDDDYKKDDDKYSRKKYYNDDDDDDDDNENNEKTVSSRITSLLGNLKSKNNNNNQKFNIIEESSEFKQDDELYDEINTKAPPPSLKDIGVSKKSIMDIKNLTDDEKQEKYNRMMFNFEVLKLKYPESKSLIPEFNQHSDPNYMERCYSNILRLVALKAGIEKYEGYLKNGFVIGEQVITGLLGFSKMSDFAANQMSNMGTYQKLLVELAEKNLESELGSNWPVEVRLIGLILFQMVVHVCGSFIFQKTGINISKVMTNNNGNGAGNNNKKPDVKANILSDPFVDDSLFE